MRVVLCDGDDLLRSMVELVVAGAGHELIGVAGTIGDAIGLVEAARPDIAIIDLALGVNADYDLTGTALASGAKVIVFSNTAYDELLSRYEPRPVVVPKPDLQGLERELRRLHDGHGSPEVSTTERRQRPTRVPTGPAPLGVSDAQAFYEALNSAVEGDALLWIDASHDGAEVAERVATRMRGGDRLLASPDAVRVFLTGAGAEGLVAFRGRIDDVLQLSGANATRSLVMALGESPTDAFDRLKRGT